MSRLSPRLWRTLFRPSWAHKFNPDSSLNTIRFYSWTHWSLSQWQDETQPIILKAKIPNITTNWYIKKNRCPATVSHSCVTHLEIEYRSLKAFILERHYSRSVVLSTAPVPRLRYCLCLVVQSFQTRRTVVISQCGCAIYFASVLYLSSNNN